MQGQAADEATLEQISGWEGARLRYVYDLGDYWESMLRRRQSRLSRQPRKSMRTGTSQRQSSNARSDAVAFDRDEINRQLSAWRGNASQSTTTPDESDEMDQLGEPDKL